MRVYCPTNHFHNNYNVIKYLAHIAAGDGLGAGMEARALDNSYLLGSILPDWNADYSFFERFMCRKP